MNKLTRKAISFVVASITALPNTHQVSGHGYMTSPRSRNLVASEETSWTSKTVNDPQPENCPQCLNSGGSLGRCGVTGKRNYDAPRNALGGLMKTNIQATYIQGEEFVVNVTLTAHHKGHFVFSACSIVHGEVPAQSCFDDNRLMFVEDMLHGAKLDANYPERAYLAPLGDSDPRYSFKMRLPSDLHGDLVLIQWYYLTANSCINEGYEEYDWPWDYGWNTGGATPAQCGEASKDGNGVPEQFWNCAEVKIVRGRNGDNENPGENKLPEKQRPDKKEQSPDEEQPDKKEQSPDKERPDKERPDKEQPDKERPDKERPDKEQPDKEQPDKEQPDEEQPDTEQPDKEKSGNKKKNKKGKKKNKKKKKKRPSRGRKSRGRERPGKRRRREGTARV